MWSWHFGTLGETRSRPQGHSLRPGHRRLLALADNLYISGDLLTDGVSNPKNTTYSCAGNGRMAGISGCSTPNPGARSMQATNTDTITGWNRLTGLIYNRMGFTYNVAGSMAFETEVSPATYTRYTDDFLQQSTKVVPKPYPLTAIFSILVESRPGRTICRQTV